MTVFRGRAPVEASAQERAAMSSDGVHSCVACRDDTGPLREIPLREFGLQWVCVQPKPCRKRAQAKGIWKTP